MVLVVPFVIRVATSNDLSAVLHDVSFGTSCDVCDVCILLPAGATFNFISVQSAETFTATPTLQERKDYTAHTPCTWRKRRLNLCAVLFTP